MSVSRVLLLPGWGFNSSVWSDVLAVMPSRAETVELPALERGLEASLDALAEIGDPAAVWVGWSLGGMLALALAARRPGSLGALLLVAALPRFVARSPRDCGVAKSQYRRFCADFVRAPERCIARFALLASSGTPHARITARRLRAAAVTPTPRSLRTLRAGLELLGSLDLVADAERVVAPVRATTGRVDALLGRGCADELRTRHPAWTISEIEDGSHALPLEQPQRLARQVEQLRARG